jgi:hypothetical protein
MNSHHFDNVIRASATSRRALFAGVLAMASGWVGVSTGAAKHKHKRKRKTKAAMPNAFGCINVGDACLTADQCCSGICEGKKGRKRCQAHDTGECPSGNAVNLCGGVGISCTTSAGTSGRCGTTTGNAGYCGSGGDCFPCAKDADCHAVCGPGAACVQCTEECDVGTVCHSPGGVVCSF